MIQVFEDRIFHLQGKNVSYVFFADGHGFLRHLYFGSKLCDLPVHLAQTAFLGAAVNFDGAQLPNDNLNAMLLENGCAQLGDYRRPSVLVRRANGSSLTDFRYEGYRLLDEHKLDGMPCVRGGKTAEIRLRAAGGLTLLLYYTVFDDSDVVVRSASLLNDGERVEIEKLSSFCLDLYDDSRDTLQLCGNWASECRVVRNSSHKGVLQISSAGRGTTSHTTNAFLALPEHNATETAGNVVAVNLVYSGSFSLTCENTSLGICRIQGGIDEENFRWALNCGERFDAPQAVLAYSDGGLGGMSRALHRFYLRHLVNPTFAYAPRPVVVNNWEGTYFNFDSAALKDMIAVSKQIGADTFVLDDGWFENRNDDTNGLGDWNVDKAKLPCGIEEIIDCCHKAGLKFGLWFEPEMVNEGTKLFALHPEWVLHNPDGGRVRARNQLVLDFCNGEVVEYVFRKMEAIIKKGVDYVKWDMNRYLADLYSASLPADRQGEVTHRYVLGVYSLAQKLVSAFPHLLIEGCSGGGGRFDAGMLYYFPQIWTSDNTDAYCRTFIQYGTSMCYPMSAMSAHYSVCPNHQTGRITSSEARFNVASVCCFGYELDVRKLTEEQREEIKEQIANYRRWQKLVTEGDLYRLANPADGLWAVCQVLPDKSCARVVGMHGLILENARPWLLKVQGLQDDALYVVQETGTEITGKTLRCAGILLPQVFRDFQTFALHLVKKQ